MKKFLKTSITTIILIIALIYLATELGILGIAKISNEDLSSYDGYYFKQLTDLQQEIYVRIDRAIKAREEEVPLGNINLENIQTQINTVITSYFYDNPEEYDVSNQYAIITKDFKIIKNSKIKLQYLTDNEYDIERKAKKFEDAIDNMLNNVIDEDMTDYEKEIAIHDALVDMVKYYKYEDINDIPSIKHTAYGALVEKEAVCDGISKALKILLERAGIENIIASGKANGISHAWNIVKLDDEYYNVDATSDNVKEGNEKYVIHAYFNVTDSDLKDTHQKDSNFEFPECNATRYEYYTTQNFYLPYEGSTATELKRIIEKENASGILEIKADERYYIQAIIDTLYDLNFANWKTKGKTSVTYNKIRDIYIFLK